VFLRRLRREQGEASREVIEAGVFDDPPDKGAWRCVASGTCSTNRVTPFGRAIVTVMGEGPGISRRDLLLGTAAAVSLQACRTTKMPPSPSPSSAAGPPVFTPPGMEGFVADCVTAATEDDAQAAVREVLARGVADPRATLLAIGEPERAGIAVFHRADNLTIFSATWTPQMNLMPHNHRMWALIGIYTGREDNIFWKRSEDGVTADDAVVLFEGDVGTLPDTAIHSVTNPLQRFTGGIHIYGGDFFATTRSQWDPDTREESPSDGAVIREIFERENERYQRAQRG
jgi:predicted metal-dependent enzyme (double-stranded beta helix superfamily)